MFSFTEISRRLTEQINIIACIECEGCIHSYASFNDHSCNINPWNLQVCLYFDQALENLSVLEDTKEFVSEFLLCKKKQLELRRHIEDNGSSISYL